MLISTTPIFHKKTDKQAIFDSMMQRVIFPSTFYCGAFHKLTKRVRFSQSCIARFLKAIVFFYKKVTLLLVIENQHFNYRDVGFLFIRQTISKNQYLRQ